MKRSQAIDEIKYFLYGPSENPDHRDEALSLLNMLEYKLGVQPPKHPTKSWNAEELTPTGNIDYRRHSVNEWESEGICIDLDERD